MRPRLALFVLMVMLLMGVACGESARKQPASPTPEDKTVMAVLDSVAEGQPDPDRYLHLTETDFLKVAKELDIEPAVIKAVVLIEAGPEMKGFWAPGVPVINFDRTMYNRYAPKAADRSGDKSAKVPSGLSGYALREWTQLVNARRINLQGADLGTFWGMFQIGGFNYKVCDCTSVEEFVSRMSYSEFEQLELFAAFLRNTGYVKDLRSKNWAAFARKYNGPSYAKRGYHTKMASAYSRFKAEANKTSGK